MSPLASAAVASIWTVTCLAALLFLPGLAALRLAAEPSRGAMRLALALGCSITLLPLALLWSSRLGLRWSGPLIWAILLGSGLVLVLGRADRAARCLTGDEVGSKPSPLPLALAAVLLLTGLSRYLQARGLVVAPWVDGYHHTLVTALLLESGSLPADYRPYLEVAPFYYHFGFHALAASLVWMGATSLPASVLVLGQALNALSVLATYALARSCLQRRLSALLAAAIPATLFWLPAYYLSWARFTQLAGLVALPAAWILLRGAMRAPTQPRRWLLSSAVCAGLLLVHVRVMAFFGVGALLLALERLPSAARALRARRPSTAATRAPGSGDTMGLADLWRLAVIGLVSLALASPWLLGNLAAGIAAMASASSDWVIGSSEIVSRVSEAPPDWLFTWSLNGFWIRLALIGLGAGLLARRRSAFGLAAALAGCLVLVAPQAIGLPVSWLLPPFALAISLWLPVALGLGLLADLAVDAASGWLQRGDAEPGPALRLGVPVWVLVLLTSLTLAASAAWLQRGTVRPWQDPSAALLAYVLAMFVLAHGSALRARWPVTSPAASGRPRQAAGLELLGVLAILCLATAGAWRMRELLRAETVLALPADLEAAVWVREQVPIGDRLLIGATNWHLGTWRGIDGGYWLPLLAGRQTSLPAALYGYGDAALIESVNSLAELTSRGDALDDAALSALLDRAQAEWIYVGPASLGRPEAFSAERLRQHPELVERYDRAGVHVFERRRP